MVQTAIIKQDLLYPSVSPVVYAVQGDNFTRAIQILLFSGGQPVTISEDCSAIICYTNPDGTSGAYNSFSDESGTTPAYDISENSFRFFLAPEMLSEPGDVFITVKITNEGKSLHSFELILSVQKNHGLEPHSENYFKIAGTVADSGWSPNEYLGTDENGNVVAKKIDGTFVKTVNGVSPDENGNVVVQGGGGGSGEAGADGFSPIATVTQTGSGAVISITDKSGTTTANVFNGKDGVPATHSWNGTTLTVTSASGTSSANLKGDKGDKGDTGAGGSPGADGVSPTVAVSKSGKVTTVSITDKNGTKTATINDGADGKDGANGSATIADGSITPEKTSFIVCEGSGEDVTTRVPNFTNRADPKSSDWKTDTRFSSSSGSQSAYTGAIVTNTIKCVAGDVVRIKGIQGGTGSTSSALFQVVGYKDEAGTSKCSSSGLLFEKIVSQSSNGIKDIVTVENGITTWTAYEYQYNGAAIQSSGFTGAVSLRIGGVPVATVDDIIITVNEPITYTEVTSGGKTYTLAEDIIVPHAKAVKSGAKWFALGDSITEGWASAVDSSASSGYKQFLNTNTAERWVNIVAEKNGYELTNYGVGGTGYAHHTSGTVDARAQVANIDFSKCDMVTLAFGVNDWKGKATLGSMDDDVNTVDAFVPNMRYVIKKILADNPYCKIFVITPLNCRSLGTYDTNWGIGYANADNASGPGLEQIFQLEKTVCEYHGIELIDMTHCSIINRENIKTMLPDYVHPTVKCHAVMARELAKKIAFQ